MSSDAAEGLQLVQSLRPPNPERTSALRSTTERILRDLGMPPEEIRAVLVADDPRLVHRHLELHRERLVEELEDRRRTLTALERELAGAALERRPVSPR
jgi:hypothetical protein